VNGDYQRRDSADLERDLGVLLEEHLELADADAKVAVGELVRDVEP